MIAQKSQDNVKKTLSPTLGIRPIAQAGQQFQIWPSFSPQRSQRTQKTAVLRIICRFFAFTHPRMRSLWLIMLYIGNCCRRDAWLPVAQSSESVQTILRIS